MYIIFFFLIFLTDWNNHNCHHEETPLRPQKPKHILFICLQTYVHTVVQATVMVWLSHMQGTNRMMGLVPGSVNKPKLPKVRLKLQEKSNRISPFFFFYEEENIQKWLVFAGSTVSSLHALCFLLSVAVPVIFLPSGWKVRG